MYFGSIRFYKHVILIVLTLVVACSVASCVLMGISNRHLKKILQENGLAVSAESPSFNSDSENQSDELRSHYPASFDYQKLYPNLAIDNDFIYKEDLPKSVYLTFDDGPSSLTPQILDILKEYNIKATFFIVYNDSMESQALYKRMISEGHTIGVHSTCHQYHTIYQSPDAFLDDFAQTALMLEQVTGVKPEILRFPGGSINSYNKAVYPQIIGEMLRRGYTYYDWNVSADDATSTVTEKQIYSNVINGVKRYNKSIVLMHDLSNKSDTVSALPDIISELKSEGYTFYPLTKDVRPVAFDYVD
ncbi:polysaccharide deacetylase family protein [Aminipila luticellarii]|uniref:Polysaccharide deacetylase n=1 Tax=Aminipila luticellarii TaxID=2507160 RepID=A0A410PSK7_9FIRM|nr:polysaccharide deacetylase family protein [Aminipila luticellarii]QAT41967.1 polysaccharide deacetylase [Aminipila luticellarii]